MAQIECKDVSLSYVGVCVSRGVSFTVEKGDYFCIVGDNGSGKTTLMKALLGLKAPDSGEIVFGDGLRVGDVGYLPQKNELQADFPASVREVVASGFVGRSGILRAERRQRREEVTRRMAQLGIAELANRSFGQLSGGQQRRALLARALCAAEKVLLLDEPTSALDPNATEELYATVARLNREDGVTVLMITHDLPAVLKYATKVLCMSEHPVVYPSAEAYASAVQLVRREAAE